jgi:8-oxo-dGTP diphosphatase
MKRRDTARAIIIHDGKVLLMERWRDGLHYFSIPGGGIEPGETAEEAAIRELAEEMSIVIRPARVLYTVHAPDAKHTIFLADYISGEAALHPDSPEAAVHARGKNLFKPAWVPLADVATLPFEYWKPVFARLARDLEQGFSAQTVDITYPDSVQ